MIGIYKITDLTNNKIYIGQSIHIQRRFIQHKKRGTSAIDKAITEKGVQNFLFQVVQQCKIEELNDKQIYWIKYYNSLQDGYNKTVGGNQVTDIYTFLDKAIIDKIKYELKNTKKSIKKIAEEYNINASTVSRINNGLIHLNPQEKYPLREKLKYEEYDIPQQQKDNYLLRKNKKLCCAKCGSPITSSSATLCVQCYKQQKRNSSKINLISRQELKEKIRKESFCSIGRQYNVTDNAIRKWCDIYNLPRRKKDIKSYTEEEWQKI